MKTPLGMPTDLSVPRLELLLWQQLHLPGDAHSEDEVIAEVVSPCHHKKPGLSCQLRFFHDPVILGISRNLLMFSFRRSNKLKYIYY